MANLIEVIVGTYEEFILGYKVENLQDESQLRLAQSFATKSHTGSIRCVAVKKHYVASGGSDDRIFIYDMKSRKEIQILHHHEGTVNALAFTPDASHLLTGSDDGKMCAIRIGTWQVEGSWKKAHSGSAVTHICCHPSGKLALTLGTDQTLRTWNLIKGRLAYTTNLQTKTELGRTPDCLTWSPDGDHFTITGTRVLEIWSVKTAGIVKKIPCDSKPTCVCWLDAKLAAVGFEDGKLWIWDFQSRAKPIVNNAHEQRVKAISYVNDILATVASSGEICLWKVESNDKTIRKIATTNIGCRPTCIALLDLTQFGDDYALKLEKENSESDEDVADEETSQSTKHLAKQRGSVVVEVEEDDNEADSDSDDQTPNSRGKAEKQYEKSPKKSNKHTEQDEVAGEKKAKKKKKKESKQNSCVEEPIEASVSKKKRKPTEEEDKPDDAEIPKKQKKKKSKHKSSD